MADIDEGMLFRMWGEGCRQDEICEALGVRPGTFWELRKRYALPPRKAAKSASGGDENPPSQEEIAAACARIRAGWSDAERERRFAYSTSQPVTLREYVFDRRDYAFSALD